MAPIISVRSAILFVVLFIVIAHIIAPVEYDWKTNTISDLGAQQYSNAWLMRVGFIGFGIIINTALLLAFVKTETRNYSDLLIIVYAFSILMTGIFSTAPFIEGQPISIGEDRLHSLLSPKNPHPTRDQEYLLWKIHLGAP
jgi:hypothetical membrane protein